MAEYIKKFFSFLRESLSEDNGHASSMRTMTFYVVMLFATSLAIGFLEVIAHYPSMILAYAGFLLTTILGALGIKTWAKGKEEESDGTPK